mmetsp:Transcript_16079/g.22415  ORF Transcript_16079/g.22415 Transcript_16079/m.22415 type:complete len:97 (-) Transcript_16079:861-1151(-)
MELAMKPWKTTETEVIYGLKPWVDQNKPRKSQRKRPCLQSEDVHDERRKHRPTIRHLHHCGLTDVFFTRQRLPHWVKFFNVIGWVASEYKVDDCTH